MNYFTMYITLIFIVKIIFIVLAIYNLYLKKGVSKTKENVSKQLEVEFWKDRVEFIFVFLMSLLLIYLFNPRFNNTNMINKETKILLTLFGFILLITAKWNDFFTESKTFKKVQTVLGRNNANNQ